MKICSDGSVALDQIMFEINADRVTYLKRMYTYICLFSLLNIPPFTPKNIPPFTPKTSIVSEKPTV